MGMRHLLVGLILLAAPASATEKGKFGAGLVLGVPFGATAKYWLDDKKAFQGTLGSSDGDLTMTGDLIHHFDEWLPRKKEGKLPLYAGLGVKYKAEARDFVGIRFVGGFALYSKDRRTELFFEGAPVLRLSPSEGGSFDGAAGIRRYF